MNKLAYIKMLGPVPTENHFKFFQNNRLVVNDIKQLRLRNRAQVVEHLDEVCEQKLLAWKFAYVMEKSYQKRIERYIFLVLFLILLQGWIFTRVSSDPAQ